VLLVVELNLIVWVGYISDLNAGNAVKELESLLAPHILCKRDGEWKEVETRELVPGDLMQLKGGDVIPADAKLVGPGEPMSIDESALTGESMAVKRKPGDQVLAGSVVAAGEMDAIVTATGKQSFFGRTMSLLDAPEERGHLYKVLNRASLGLALIGFLGCLIIFLVLLVGRNSGVGYALVTAFVIYVAVIPIGMPVVTTTVLAVGAQGMAKEKAVVSRLTSLEELSGMEVLASDKTGTLTLNRLTLDKKDILAWGGYSQEQVLLLAALSAKWSNNDAIDRAVTAAVEGGQEALGGYKIKSQTPFNPVDKRTTATYTDPAGMPMVATKGAPQIIRDLLSDQGARGACDKYIAQRASRGLRSLGVAISADEGASWHLAGLISLLDPPREDSARTIAEANKMGVQVKMVTGDQYAIAVETCKRLGLGTNIMEGSELMQHKVVDAGLIRQVDEVDGFAGVYPEHKHRIVEALQAKGRLVGMTGDGVNDAPALKKANVGIAVAGATPAAKGAADIILTEEGIGTIITAIKHSHVIFRRLETYIIYRIASSLLILGFFFLAIIIFDFEMPTWVLVLISLLNDISVMATSFDKVHGGNKPMRWNMTKNLVVAASLAIIGIVGSLVMVAFAHPTLWFEYPGISPQDPPSNVTSGPEVAVIFMVLTAIIQLQIISTRNPSFWWHFSKKTAPRPSLLLLAPVITLLTAATFVAVYWPARVKPDGGRGSMEGAGWVPILITWGYAIVFWQLADVAKWAAQKIMITHEDIKELCKEADMPLPVWVKVIDWPGQAAERVTDLIDVMFHRLGRKILRTLGFKKQARRPLSKQDVQQDINMTLSQRDISGSINPEIEQELQRAIAARAEQEDDAKRSSKDWTVV
jgi:H+-transporting ATPase